MEKNTDRRRESCNDYQFQFKYTDSRFARLAINADRSGGQANYTLRKQKETMATITLSQAKRLCTAKEMEVVEASQKKNLENLSAKELRAKRSRARQLRDKWRDQATSQRREAQQAQGARDVDDAERSQQKQQLFSEVLERFEKQLSKLDGDQVNRRGKAGGGSPSKQVRAQEHRAARAKVREELSEKQELLAAQSTATPRKAAAKKKKAATGATKSAVKKTAKKAPATKAAKKAAAKAKAAVKKKLPTKKKSNSGGTAIPPAEAGLLGSRTPWQQLAAETAAKKTRVRESGLTSRVRGHVSARTRRSQGRRDQSR